MKLSYEWLKEYVDLSADAEEVARGLTMSGSEVESMEKAGNDTVMDLEITSNRPDCLSITGLAREASAVFDQDLKMPSFDVQAGEGGPSVECVIKDKDLCPRYTARIITDVKVKPAGRKITDRLTALGMRPVNNIVDVTNYCLMELGQPLHAFDLDKLEGGKVIIRRAKKGEKITTIDGVERELGTDMLVIADAKKPVAVAGVMGGLDTEVSPSTKNILLESAYFDPLSVRRTARALGLSSDSSYRFERGVDKDGVAAASDRAAALIAGETGGRVLDLYDEGKIEAEKAVIEIDLARTGMILGVELDKEKIKGIFSRLGISLLEDKEDVLKVQAPSFREDLKRDVDLIEEAARIYGYDKIPATVNRFVPGTVRREHSRVAEEKLRETLVALGFNEIMTYSLVNEEAVKRFSKVSPEPVELSNPLSEEQRYLTPNLLDGMLKAISWNTNRSNRDLKLFEIGKLYTPAEGGKGYSEERTLCIGMTGASRRNWKDGSVETSVYEVKGAIEAVLEKLRVKAAFKTARIEGLVSSAGITAGDAAPDAGFMGEVSGRMLDEYGITQPVYVCQVKIEEVLASTVLKPRYHAIPRFPLSTRDVSVLCENSLSAGDILDVINRTGEELIKGAELVDIYEGKNIPAGKKSLTYSIQYGLDTRTLTDDEIEAVHQRVKDALSGKLGVTFR